MASFLSWVFSQASKVYDWFGSAYYSLKNAAYNAWDWAVDRASEALNAAKQYAYNLLQQAQGGITSAINWLQNQVASIRAGIYEDITALTDWVEWKISQVGNFASDVFWDAIDNVRALINLVRDGLNEFINRSIDYVRGWVTASFGWVIDLRNDIMNILSVLTRERLNALVNFLTTGLNALLSFIQNPLGFILDVIQDKFISFFCYVLAHALGTTKYELPNSPPWKGR